MSIPETLTSFTLKAEATDNETGIAKYEFYVNDELKETIETSEQTTNYTVREIDTGDTNCYVIVYDGLGNVSKVEAIGTTKLYLWKTYRVIETVSYEIDQKDLSTGWVKYSTRFKTTNKSCMVMCFNNTNGKWHLWNTASGGSYANNEFFNLLACCVFAYRNNAHRYGCYLIDNSADPSSWLDSYCCVVGWHRNGTTYMCEHCFDLIRYTSRKVSNIKKGEATGNYVTDANLTRYKTGDVINGLYYEYIGIT